MGLLGLGTPATSPPMGTPDSGLGVCNFPRPRTTGCQRLELPPCCPALARVPSQPRLPAPGPRGLSLPRARASRPWGRTPPALAPRVRGSHLVRRRQKALARCLGLVRGRGPQSGSGLGGRGGAGLTRQKNARGGAGRGGGWRSLIWP